jgi:hypothetical protein
VSKVEIQTKFNIGDELRIKDTKKVGTVKSFRIDSYMLYGQQHVVIKYCLQTGLSYQQEWVTGEQLEEVVEDTSSVDFGNEFEIGLRELLIDIYLLNPKNLPLIRELHNEIQQIVRIDQ